jgi:predicted phosphodiesterase
MVRRMTLLAALLLVPPGSTLAVDIEGALSGYLPADTYTVTGDIWVVAGNTLTLAPGVVFEFESGLIEDYDFTVYGTLTAEGTESLPIVFHPAAGVEEFNYIKLCSSGSHLDWCVIEGAGKVTILEEGGLWIDDCSPLVENTEIHGNRWHGVFVTGSSAQPELVNCNIHDNADDGVDCYDGAGINLRLSSVTSNGKDGICLSSGPNLIVNCLVAGNGENGIDCHWMASHPALIVSTTFGSHPDGAVSSASAFDMYNCAGIDQYDWVNSLTHTYIIDVQDFFGFTDPGGLDFHLEEDSPLLEQGYRFGAVESLLTATDLDGNPRINGIIDIGAYESTTAPSSGEEGLYFSRALVFPRMTCAAIRTPGESFTAMVALLGTYTAGDAAARLIGPTGQGYSLSVTGVTQTDRTPDSDIFVTLYGPGIERIQEVEVSVPAGTPEGFYGIEVDLGPYSFQSIHAVRILDQYPDSWGFIHISDSHIQYDNEGITTAERFRWFARESAFLDPEFIVHTGDACDSQHVHTAFNDSLLKSIAQLRVPFSIVTGNHDHYNWDWVSYNPAGYLYYFQQVNRVMNREFRFGECLLYCCDSGPDEGLIQLARCYGPTTPMLDWLEALISGTSWTGPYFFLTHGPTFDMYMWSMHNTDRVVSMLDAYGFSLGIAGHTHRVDTYLNEGTNFYGRDDFFAIDDWERDIPFPGYPLHVQTSSLGKGKGLGIPESPWLSPMPWDDPVRAGIESDSIAWRWIQIDNGEVDFFTSDTDNDGYRNTEKAWLLGRITFEVESLPDGVIRSTVTNSHFETWFGVRHYIPAVPATLYDVSGGTLVRQYPDGTVEVLVDSIAEVSASVVTLSPVGSSNAGSPLQPGALALSGCRPNPFSESVEILFAVPGPGADVRIEILDLAGRVLHVPLEQYMQGGSHTTVWTGCDTSGQKVASGLYFCRLRSGNESVVKEVVLLSN